ncbi:hypothetical protein AJ87_38775 [Rhizobium yanglingense]|nr:hypothetical protein AJ87_38775 [Rhizobium yanglingense]
MSLVFHLAYPFQVKIGGCRQIAKRPQEARDISQGIGLCTAFGKIACGLALKIDDVGIPFRNQDLARWKSP